MTQEQAETWQRFCRETGHTGEPAFIGAFGDGPDLADELLDLILADRKRATCCLSGWYVRQGLELPRAGDLSLILDGEGRPRCVIRTTAARVAPFSAGDADFARAEGEGDGSFAYWHAAHTDYFGREGEREGFVFDESMPVVFEHFERIWTA